MPDISMCCDTKCPQKFNCYRFMAEPHSHRQSYAGFQHEKETGKCLFMMPIKQLNDFNKNETDIIY